MTSLISQTKQIPANAGYYITLKDATAKLYANTGDDSAPVMNNPIMASTLSTPHFTRRLATSFAVIDSLPAVFRSALA